jgi:hypothetical protein
MCGKWQCREWNGRIRKGNGNGRQKINKTGTNWAMWDTLGRKGDEWPTGMDKVEEGTSMTRRLWTTLSDGD